MRYLYGDLVKMAKADYFDVIIHGCNCFCTMGAGIARQVKYAFPSSYEADCMTKRGDRDKLGTITIAKAKAVNDNEFYIVNAYTQFDFRNGRNINYDAIRSSLFLVKGKLGEKGYRFGMPLIGIGLAGGDWQRIRVIVEEALAGEEVTVVVLPGQIVRDKHGGSKDVESIQQHE